MPWVELAPDSRIGYAKDQVWTPSFATTGGGSSGWDTSVCRYKRIGNLIVAQGKLQGDYCYYGTGNWLLNGLPATPRDDGGGVHLGYTYYYNVGRASYGSILYYGGQAQFVGINASNGGFQIWNHTTFTGPAGWRSINMRLMYEAA